MNQSALIAEITAAFQDEPYPGDADITHDNTGSQLEGTAIREAFKGYAWQSVPDEVLSTQRTGLSLMNKEGLKHYLPAFLCAVLRNSSVVGEGLSMILLELKLPIELDSAVVAEKIQQYEAADKLPAADLDELLQNQLAQTNTKINAFIASASQFTQAQARAIYHFLVYVRDDFGNELLSTEAGLAIQRYWFQFA